MHYHRKYRSNAARTLKPLIGLGVDVSERILKTQRKWMQRRVVRALCMARTLCYICGADSSPVSIPVGRRFRRHICLVCAVSL